jgi:hypothetical protein
MSHLLIDVDSKIPNLALMKISQFLKSRGERVVFHRLEVKDGNTKSLPPEGEYETVWISCVFTWNVWAVRLMEKVVTAKRYEKGGSGYDLKVKLPDEIEFGQPDYALYDYYDTEGKFVKNDRASGFVLRGCIRKCDFCLVNRKEGKITDNVFRPIESWVPDGFEKVLLLDNEFAAYDPKVYPPIKEDIELRTIRTLEANGWKYSITQGYDLRCVDERKAGQLADYKPMDLKFREKRLYCAWDYLGIEPAVRKGIELLKKAGFKGREITVYCLVGMRSTHDEDLHRFNVLWKEYGALPFLMRYRPLDGSEPRKDRWLDAFCRYVNRGPASYRNHSFEDYLNHRPEVKAEVFT